MMHGRGKSDAAIVAVKPTNKGGAIRRGAGGAKGGGQGECEPAKHATGRSTGPSVSQALGAHTIRRESGAPVGPEAGAVCGKAACTDLCGGRSVMGVPTATAAQCGEIPRIALRSIRATATLTVSVPNFLEGRR